MLKCIKDKLSFILPLILSTSTILAIYLFYGIYLDEFEVLTDLVVRESRTLKTQYPYANNENFLMYAQLSYIQQLFKGVSIHGIWLTTLTVISFTYIFNSILQHEKKLTTILLCFVIFIFSMENIILLSTSKVAVLLSLSSFLLLGTIESPTLKNRTIPLLPFIIALFVRIEYPIIIASFAFAYAILFNKKKLYTPITTSIILGILVFSTYAFLVYLNVDGIQDFRQYEKEIYHKFNSVFNIISTNNLNSLTEDQLKLLAKGLFLLDEPNLNSISYNSLVQHHSTFDYIFNNKEFANIYLNKLGYAFKIVLHQFFYLTIASLLSVIVLLYFSISRRKTLQATFLLLMYISLFLGVNLFAELHYRFLSSFLLAPILIALFLLSNRNTQLTKNMSSGLFLLYLSLGLLYLSKDIRTISADKEHLENRAMAVHDSFKNDIAHQLTPFLGYLEYDGILPSKLFRKDPNISWYFLDAGTLNELKHFKILNQRVFGENYPSLKNRIKQVIQQNGYLYISKKYIEFYQVYLQKIHHYSFNYEIDRSFGDGSFNKYKIYEVNE